jgi:hypothetical protein
MYMTPQNYLRTNKRLILGLLLCFLFFCCKPGRPIRKTLPPGFVSLNDQVPGYNTHPPPMGVLFYYSDTSLLWQGFRRKLAVITLASPDKDSLIRSVIEAGRGLLPYLVTQLQGDNKSGLVVDLRVEGSELPMRQDYLISLDKTDPMPVVFLWDRASASRASYFISEFEQFPGLSWSITRNQTKFQNDCFEDIHPSF